MGLYIGIDLGTTYSAVAYVGSAGTPQIIQTTQDSVTTPSAVYISSSGDVLIGEDAKEEQKSKSQVATFYKRNIGQNVNSYYLEDGNSYSSIDLSAIFLKELIRRTEEKMGQKVEGAVITVPAYFTDHEKNNTKKAAEKAGINVLHMVNEPTAAAVAYGLDKSSSKKILVYDLGGGTFDVSVAQIDEKSIKIIATKGNHQLGGKDWDIEICNWAAEKFEEEYGDDFSSDPEQMDAIMVDAEKVKRNLSKQDKTDMRVKYCGNNKVCTLTEKEFRERTRWLLERTGEVLSEMFAENNMSWSDIDDVILVGGSTRMRMVEDYIVELSGKPALRGINPDEAVALGAALLAKSISDTMNSFSLEAGNVGFELSVGSKKVEDVNSHSLGLIAAREEQMGNEKYQVFYNEIMIKKNTSLENARATRKLQLHSDTLDIYLTQWESDTIPDKENIIGKYQVNNIVPDTPFDVTYFHNVDGTVNIQAEQNNRMLTVTKVLDYVDRSFEPELMKSAKGSIVIAIDLSGSMCGLCDDAALDELMRKMDANTLTEAERNQVIMIAEYIDLMKDGGMEKYKMAEKLSADIWYSALYMTKQAVRNFVQQFPADSVSFSIIGFADKIKEFCPITYDRSMINRAIDSLAITPDTGECNNIQPMDRMLEMITNKRILEKLDFTYAVVLTDGYWSDEASAQALRAKPRYVQQGIEIIAQGFGDAKESFISELATIKELSGVGDISNLAAATSNIAKVITDGFY